VVAEADRLAGVMYTDEWLHGIRRPVRDGRTVRVASGVDVVQRLRKTAGGLVRATLEVRDGTVLGASISGDFFFYPEEKLADLAAELEGVPLAGVQGTIEGFYQKHGVDSPGLAPAELASILQGTP